MLLKIGKFIRLKSTKIFGKNFILVILFSLTFFSTVPSFAIDMNSANTMVSQSSTQQRSGLVIWANLGSLTQSNPINITSNNQFSLVASQKNWPGTGTKQSPIIIENLLIQNFNLTRNYCGFCVENTNLYFVFRQNVINTTSLAGQFNQYSIKINNTENAQIVDNNLTSNDFQGIGMYIGNSNNIRVINNIFNNFFTGSIISNSNITYNNNLLQNNYIATSFQDILSKNSFGQSLYYTVLFQSNIYFNNNFGLVMTGTEIVHLRYTIKIEQNVFNQNPFALTISSYSVTMTNNYFANNSNYGISLMRSLFSNISNNMFNRNGIGIKLINPNYSPAFTQFNCQLNPYIPECSESQTNSTFQLHVSNITISDNIIANQTDVGISIASEADQNFILENNFMNNIIQADQQSTNNWNNNTNGNYWSDYTGMDSNNDGIGDTPYLISVGGTDNKPLMDKLAISVNNSALLQTFIKPRGLVDSAIYYSIFIVPLMAGIVALVTIVTIWRYKKYVASLASKPQKKISFAKFVKKNVTTRPKKKQGELHGDKALELLEEIMNETGFDRPL